MKTGKQGGKLTKGQKQTVIIAGICAVLLIAAAVINAVRASKAGVRVGILPHQAQRHGLVDRQQHDHVRREPRKELL